uniref:Putative reverse transcriptase n=1 Tax=Ixodes ricinus TaxID=34613 RepID=A0A0K8RCP2_IXORI
MEGGENLIQVIPGLTYADGIVVVADNQDRLEELAGICGEEGDTLGMRFKRDKSGVMVFDDEKREPLWIQVIVNRQCRKIQISESLNEGSKHQEEHDENIIRKGKRK